MDSTVLESLFLFGDMPKNTIKGTFIPFYVFASFVLASIGAFTGLSASSLVPRTTDVLKAGALRWLGAFAYATGFWAMHFTGMFAYRLPLPVNINPWIALASLAVTMVLTFMLTGITRSSETPSLKRVGVAAFLSALCICAMHFTGLRFLELNASIQFIPSYAVLALLFAVIGQSTALAVIFWPRSHETARATLYKALGGFVMGATFWGSFYIALWGTVITPISGAAVHAAELTTQIGPMAVFAAVILFLFILTFSISNRLVLVGGFASLFAIPLIFITHQSISTLDTNISNVEKIRSGILIHKELSHILRDLQDIRDLSLILKIGRSGSPDFLSSKRKHFESHIKQVDERLHSLKDFKEISRKWPAVKQNLLSFQEISGGTAHENNERYSFLIRDLIFFANETASHSGITTEAEKRKDFFLDYTIDVLPHVHDVLSLARGYASAFLAARPQSQLLSRDDKKPLEQVLVLMEHYQNRTKNMLDRAETSRGDVFALSSHFFTTVKPLHDRFSLTVIDLLENTTEPQISPSQLFALGSEVMSSYDLFYDAPFMLLENDANETQGSLVFMRNVMLYTSIAAFIGFFLLFIFLNRTLAKTQHARQISIDAQKELAMRLAEKERLERQMQDYTDRLELSRFDVLAANTKLMEEEAKIRSIMDNVLEGIVTLNEYAIIQTFNRGAEIVFGYTAKEAIGRIPGFLLPPDQEEEAVTHLRRYLSTGEEGIVGIEHETVGQRKDGSSFPMIVKISEVAFDKTRLLIVLIRDITHQKEREAALLRMKERAEIANQTKSDFLANMSHELRTPLNSVHGMTRLLLGTHLTTEQQELANTVLLSTNNLMEIVNDILDLSKIEAGEIVLERIGFDPHQVFHSVVRSVAHIAREKHVPILRLYENETFPFVLGDPMRFGRILTNLLSNAIKFTEVGHIEIHARTKRVDHNHIELLCEVTDTGIGIAPDKVDSVFDKFVQADNSTTRRFGGTGLGLAITRELVLRMGGRIGARSIVNEGSTFWFIIPFETTDKIQSDKYYRFPRPKDGGVPAKSAKVLVAEDHPMNQLLIKRLLQKFGIGEIKLVSTGLDAVNAFEQGSWTTVLMDCHMPEMNGYDATIAIREIEKTTKTHLPIIAMTANAMVGDKEKCLNCGMDEYISKPIEIEELKDVLAQWIAFDENITIEGLKEIFPEEKPPVDLTMLRTLTGGEVEIEKELMHTFVEQSDKNIETMKENSDKEGENKEWSEAAHMLKGGSGSIGAEDLRTLCSEAQLFKGDCYGREALLEKIEKEYDRVKDHLKKEGLLT